MAKDMSRLKKRQRRGEFLMTLPLILFTLLFIVGPLVYMVALSFMTRAETWGVVPEFTLHNYASIGEPVYLRTFGESLKLAVISTVLIIALGYPFGYFMAKLGPKWKRRTMLLLMIPFWTSSLIRLYGWIIIFRAGGGEFICRRHGIDSELVPGDPVRVTWEPEQACPVDLPASGKEA